MGTDLKGGCSGIVAPSGEILMDLGSACGTAHVVVETECFHDGHAPQILDQLQHCVAAHFDVGIDHSTFQLEPATHTQHEHPTHH